MTQPSSEHPNVIVFFTDQRRWDTMGLHGNPMDLTPNLDRMAQRKVYRLVRLTNELRRFSITRAICCATQQTIPQRRSHFPA